MHARELLRDHFGQARVDRLARMQEIAVDRLVAFLRLVTDVDAQAAFAEDCRAAGLASCRRADAVQAPPAFAVRL